MLERLQRFTLPNAREALQEATTKAAAAPAVNAKKQKGGKAQVADVGSGMQLRLDYMGGLLERLEFYEHFELIVSFACLAALLCDALLRDAVGWRSARSVHT